MSIDGSDQGIRAVRASDRRAWITWLVTLGLFAIFVVVGLSILRNELRSCFGGCGANGCGRCGSMSRAPSS